LQPSATILIMVALVIPVVLLLARFGPRVQASAASSSQTGTALSSQPMAWGALSLVAFVLVLACLSYPQAATTTFLPKWLSDAGFSSRAFGSLMSTYLIASAFGNVFGGALADRWSRKGVVMLALAIATPPFYALYHAPGIGALTVLAAALAGFATGMPQSVLILMGQNLFPGRMGLASGLVLGGFFSLNALAAWVTGVLADQIGLSEALLIVPVTCVLGAICATVLPRTRRRAVPAPAFVPGE
jgi:FSR family fosmidomycin resistance protein-like MFS transporter